MEYHSNSTREDLGEHIFVDNRQFIFNSNFLKSNNKEMYNFWPTLNEQLENS